MSSLTTKKKKRKLAPGKLLKAVLLLFVCFYFIFTLINQQIDLSKYKAVSADYSEKIQAANLEQKQLKDELDQTSTDEYMERMAREKLGLVKSNERVFIDVTSGE